MPGVHVRGAQALPLVGGDEVPGHEGGAGGRGRGGRPALQRQRAAPLRGALLQALHLLRPLRLAALRPHQAGPAVRGYLLSRRKYCFEEKHYYYSVST